MYWGGSGQGKLEPTTELFWPRAASAARVTMASRHYYSISKVRNFKLNQSRLEMKPDWVVAVRSRSVCKNPPGPIMTCILNLKKQPCCSQIRLGPVITARHWVLPGGSGAWHCRARCRGRAKIRLPVEKKNLGHGGFENVDDFAAAFIPTSWLDWAICN